MEKISESKRGTGKGFILGIILVLIGFALIGNQFNLFPFHLRHIIFSWQMFLILLGFAFFTTRDNKTTGYILMGVGGFFLLPEIFNLSYGFRQLFWPLVFIIIGLVIIFKGTSFMKSRRNYAADSDMDYIDDVNVFGGHNRIITSPSFRGGSIVSVFGGGKYDLRKSNLSVERNELEIVNILGGSNLIVPPEWDVKIEVTAIFGGFSDKRMVSNTDPGKKLIIKGVALFGGGEITS